MYNIEDWTMNVILKLFLSVHITYVHYFILSIHKIKMGTTQCQSYFQCQSYLQCQLFYLIPLNSMRGVNLLPLDLFFRKLYRHWHAVQLDKIIKESTGCLLDRPLWIQQNITHIPIYLGVTFFEFKKSFFLCAFLKYVRTDQSTDLEFWIQKKITSLMIKHLLVDSNMY